MGKITQLHAAQGSLLATVSLWRMPDGSTRAVLDDMPAHVIESEEAIAARFVKAAMWTAEGASDLLRQANRFDQENREDPPHA